MAFNANHISYTRIPERYYDAQNDKGWTTLVLPFAATNCQATIDGVVTPLNWYTGSANGDLLLATYQYQNGSEMVFGLPESELKSSHPYLMGVPSALNRGKSLVNVPITFSADNVEVVAAKSPVTGRDYKMIGTLSPISNFVLGTHSVNPFHAYFVPIGAHTPASNLTINMYVDIPTSITEMFEQQNGLQGPYYNINGQRVSKPEKGIYITNGKKVIFK